MRQLQGTAADLEWLSLRPNTTLAGNNEELLIKLPESVRIENGFLINTGQSIAKLRYADLEFSNLQARFSDDFQFQFNQPGISQGRIEFFSENQLDHI